jgi:gliding motility-associated-like protein
MRYWFCILLFCLLGEGAMGQGGKNKPKIRGQQPNPITINEDAAYTIQLQNLEVRDRDNWFYPWGFSLKVYPGDNYTLEGAKVIPTPNFFGRLEVPVTVNDGSQDSDKFNVKIDVVSINDAPTIESQVSLSTNENQPIALKVSDLVIKDPDDTQFTLIVSGGSNYTVSANTITPNAGFTGNLTVGVSVNDGEATSSIFQVTINVIPLAASITGQIPLEMQEDASFQVMLNQLVVKDPRNKFPAGFTVLIQQGNDYTFNNTTVTPSADFTGTLIVNVLINDGQRNSNVYPLRIAVKPVNDAPEIVDLEEQPIIFEAGEGPYQFSNSLTVYDPDNDSLRQVEVGFDVATYRYGIDELTVELSGGINGQFNADQAKIVLTGRAKKSDYVNVIRSIQYNTLLPDEPLMESKKIWITASDGTLTGAMAEREIKPYSLTLDLDIPTAFTPNGDHSNDTWVIKTLKQSEELTKAVIRVYTRTGKLLFEAVGIDKEWDGTWNGQSLPADSYFYTIDFGVQYLNNSVKGIVTILR